MSEIQPLKNGDTVTMTHRYGTAIVVDADSSSYLVRIELFGRNPEYRYESVPRRFLTRVEA